MNSKSSKEFWNATKVVVIDDDANSLDVAAILLEFAGADVRTAENGQYGLAVIKAFKPTVVLSDISMPVLDGWELIEQVRQNQSWSEMIVIALTAHAMVGDREKVLQAGFDGYLSKPLQPDTFISNLEKVISTSQSTHHSHTVQQPKIKESSNV